MGSKIRSQKSIIIPLNLSKRYDSDHDHDPDDANRPVPITNCKRRRYNLLNADQERRHDEPEEEEEEKEKKEIEVVVDRFNPSYVLRSEEEEESGSDSSDDHRQFRQVKLVTKRGHGSNFRFGDPLEALNTVCKLKGREQSDDDDTTTYQLHEEKRKREDQPRDEKTKHRVYEIEDQMYESDMLMHTLESTIRLVEKGIEFSRPKGRLPSGAVVFMDREDYLQFKHLRCIENLYDDHRIDVINLLRADPTVVLPVVLKRLVQKRGELIRFRRALRHPGSSKSIKVPENYQAPQYTSHTMTR